MLDDEVMMDDQEYREDEKINRYLVFSVNGQSFAIEIEYVREIIEVLPIVRVPGIPTSIKGVVNIRGLIVPVIDMRLRFGYEEIQYDERTCIIVIESKNVSVGIIVDRVEEIMNVSEEKIMSPSSDDYGIGAQYVKGVTAENGAIQLILDCEKTIELA